MLQRLQTVLVMCLLAGMALLLGVVLLVSSLVTGLRGFDMT